MRDPGLYQRMPAVANIRMTNRFRSPRALRRSRGFSIIELLVAIIIIGILTAVLLPVISQRTEQARQATAQSELQIIGEAQSRAANDTGFYVRLFALNDKLASEGGQSSLVASGSTAEAYERGTNANNTVEGLADYLVNNLYYEFQGTATTDNSLFIDPRTGDFALGQTRAGIISRLARAESVYDGTIIWGGPYLNFRKDENSYQADGGEDGIPDDPWGNNYMFFTQAGFLLEPDGVFLEDVSVDASTGEITSGATYDAQIFDRGTILSLGGNGLPGDGAPTSDFGLGDDLYRSFGQ